MKITIKTVSLIGALFILLSTLASDLSAAVVNDDWKNSGDNLITLDTVTGLRWLDLSASYGLNYDYVSGQLGVGGDFDGFRYATTAEVVNLWVNFSIDLAAGAPTSSPGLDANVTTATSFLGNTWNTYAWWDYPFGVSGITGDANGAGRRALGAYQADFGGTFYETAASDGITIADNLANIQPYGSYLVEASAVPVPAAAWLFGSALIGLGFIKRKKA